MKKILMITFTVTVIMISFFVYQLILEQSAKGVILSLGNMFNMKDFAHVKSIFSDKATFVYNDCEIGYIEVLKNLEYKVRDNLITGDIYVGEVNRISLTSADISFLGWVTIKDTDFEISGYVHLVKGKWLSWKIRKMESDNIIFNEVFLK